MRVLWLCNIMLPFIAKSLGQKIVVKEGWLSGLASKLMVNQERNDITLAICFPASENLNMVKGDTSLFVKNKAQGIEYYIFREDTLHPENYDAGLEESLGAIIRDFEPDLVHIFGTEYPHTLACVKAFDHPERTLIGIQGLCSAIAEVYMADLPYSVQKKKTFRDILKKDGLFDQQAKFAKRGEYEKEALALVGHVTGRTDFDREMTKKFAPNAKYHFMNETLRSDFYHDTWSIDRIERYSLFLSQGNYPIKGLHYVIDILPEIIEEFEETVVYVAGDVITANDSIKDKIKISGYGKFLLSQIKKNKLQDHVRFVGRLQSDRMCARFLKTHVFLCPSAIENSPNSVGEAMLLGVPVVSADVGGVHNLVDDGRDGILYPKDKPKRLKDSILRIFEDDKLAVLLSSNAKAHALRTHDPDTNYRRLLDIYRAIVNGKSVCR
ncbi:MAG: glycosyltransferase family 4 protein [Lachnospiraceae bacterium]|nr:glycosyltransferase family 4 protein [Lachnospiraceae bacterium]